jgi:hypothetical protein
MLDGGVVDHEVDQHAHAALLAGVRQLDEITQRPVAGIDRVMVGDVVAVVLAGRFLERHEPDRVDAQPVEVIEAPLQALEVADAVAGGVHVGLHVEAIDDGVLVPEVVDHGDAGAGEASPGA